jgi:hypothetical protein
MPINYTGLCMNCFRGRTNSEEEEFSEAESPEDGKGFSELISTLCQATF